MVFALGFFDFIVPYTTGYPPFKGTILASPPIALICCAVASAVSSIPSPVYETPVGFRYVAPKMIAEDALIGGEESSGFGFRGHIPERDGILSGIYFLDLMVKLNKTPSELLDYLYSKVGPHHYQRIDLEFPPGKRESIVRRLTEFKPDSLAGTEVVGINTFDGFHFLLADGSWLLIRFSGTEPILRIYSEAGSLARAWELIAQGRKILGV